MHLPVVLVNLPLYPPIQPVLHTAVIVAHDFVLELGSKLIHLRLVYAALPCHARTERGNDGDAVGVNVIVPKHVYSGSSSTGLRAQDLVIWVSSLDLTPEARKCCWDGSRCSNTEVCLSRLHDGS